MSCLLIAPHSTPLLSTISYAWPLLQGYFTLSHVATELPFEVPQLEEKAAQAVHLLTGIPALAKKKSD